MGERVIHMGEDRCCGVLVGNLREKDHLDDVGLDGRIILKRIFKNQVGGVDWVDLVRERKRQREGFCERYNESSVSTECGEFLDQLAEELLAFHEGLCLMELGQLASESFLGSWQSFRYSRPTPLPVLYMQPEDKVSCSYVLAILNHTDYALRQDSCSQHFVSGIMYVHLGHLS